MSINCNYCGKSFPKKTCMRCKEISYCSRECQKNDWPMHKKICSSKKLFCVICSEQIDVQLTNENIFSVRGCYKNHTFHSSCINIFDQYYNLNKCCIYCELENKSEIDESKLIDNKCYEILKKLVSLEIDSNKSKINKVAFRSKFRSYIDELEQISKKHNNFISQFYLFKIYHSSKYIQINMKKAKSYCLKSAENGFGDAQFCMGKMYYDGIILKKNIDEAKKWLMLASRNNIAESQFMLYNILNDKEGFEYLKLSLKYNHAPAKLEYALKYAKTNNIKFKYLLDASKLGHCPAQFILASCYCEGSYGITKDFDMAIYWYTKASNLGDSYSKYNLAIIYEREEFQNQNNSKALKYYREAAELNLPQAQFKLYLIFKDGLLNVEANKEISIRWLKKAYINNFEDAKIYEQIKNI